MRKKRPNQIKTRTEPTDKKMHGLINLYNQGQYAKVEKLVRQLTLNFPKHPFGWKVLGVALQGLGRFTESVDAKKISVSLTPNDTEAIYNLGNSLRKLGRLAEAEDCYKKVITLKPDEAMSYYNLGLTLEELGRGNEAENYYRTVINLDPQHINAHNNLGVILSEQNCLEEAEHCYRTTLDLNPDYIEAYCNLGSVLIAQGRLQESEASYRQALDLNPQHLRIYSSLFTSLNYNNYSPREFCLSEEKQFGKLATQQVTTKFSYWLCDPQPKRLRIGFVSEDFWDHPASYFLENLLAQWDNSTLDLFAYPNFLKNVGKI